MKPQLLLKSVLLGLLVVYLCLLPLGIFESIFWNNWQQNGSEFPKTDTAAFWMQVAKDAIWGTVLAVFKFWFVTIPFAGLYARWIFKRLEKRRDPERS